MRRRAPAPRSSSAAAADRRPRRRRHHGHLPLLPEGQEQEQHDRPVPARRDQRRVPGDRPDGHRTYGDRLGHHGHQTTRSRSPTHQPAEPPRPDPDLHARRRAAAGGLAAGGPLDARPALAPGPDHRHRRRRLRGRHARADDRDRRRPRVAGLRRQGAGDQRHRRRPAASPHQTQQRRHRRPDRRARHLRPRRRRARPAQRQLPRRAAPASSASASPRSRRTCPTSSTHRRGHRDQVRPEPATATRSSSRSAAPRSSSRSSACAARSARSTRPPGATSSDAEQPAGPRSRAWSSATTASRSAPPSWPTASPSRPARRARRQRRSPRPRRRRPIEDHVRRSSSSTTSASASRTSRVTSTPTTRSTSTASIYFASGGAKFFPGRPFTATITDRITADDVNPDGTPNDEALRASADLQPTARSTSFQLKIDTLRSSSAPSSRSPRATSSSNTGAADDEELVSFAVGRRQGQDRLARARRRGAQLRASSATARSRPSTGFGVFLSVGSATGDSFKWPSFLPIRIDAIGIEWADIENAPRGLRADPVGQRHRHQGLSRARVLRLDRGHPDPAVAARRRASSRSSASTRSASPSRARCSAARSTPASSAASCELDANYNIDRRLRHAPRRCTSASSTSASRAASRWPAWPASRSASASPSSARCRRSSTSRCPAASCSSRTTGLTINDFAAGVEFFKTLPSIEDPFALRNAAFGLPTDLTADQWLDSLQQPGRAARRKRDRAQPGA